ncbi:hypothetical protein ACFCV8_07285 [Streptomyces sp. NPDC056347]|uniref:hypothetical protein n=1 Tax=Streptomyces sp. NPDC056347 TaxID=3345790 RepID=UPI0035E33FED
MNIDGRRFQVRILKEADILTRWGDVELALRKAFKGAHYNDAGYSSDNPVRFTRSGVDGDLGAGVVHLIAEDEMQEIVGGFFCLPTRSQKGDRSCDVGWVFLDPDLDRRYRRGVLGAMMEKGFQIVKAGGFERIVSNMGTEAGSAALTRYGFEHSPVPGKWNRWVKEL